MRWKLKLLKEILIRKWDCTVYNGDIHLILGNAAHIIRTNSYAKQLLKEIKTYW